MTTKEEKKQKHAKKLFRLKKDREDLQEQLKQLNEKIAKEEEKVIDIFKNGIHTVGKLVITVATKTIKGRGTPSWKKIAEDMDLAVDEFKDSLIDNDFDSKTANQFAKLMKGAYNRTKEKYTTKSEDRDVTTVEIQKAS